MTESVLKIILSGMSIFSDERRRQLSEDLYERVNKVNLEKAKRFPHFNNDRLALAKKDLDAWTVSYEKEYGTKLQEFLDTLGARNA